MRLGAAPGALNVSRRELGTGRGEQIERFSDQVQVRVFDADRVVSSLEAPPGCWSRTTTASTPPGSPSSRAAVDAGCDVIVAAPARESSGTSASLVDAELDGRLVTDEKAAPDFELLLQVLLAVIGVTLAARLTGEHAT